MLTNSLWSYDLNLMMPPVLRIIVYTLGSALRSTFLTKFWCGVILVTVQSRPGDKYFWIFFWGLICSESYGLWHQWRNFPCLCWGRRSHDLACNIRNVTWWHDGVWRVTRGRDRDWPQHVHHHRHHRDTGGEILLHGVSFIINSPC